MGHLELDQYEQRNVYDVNLLKLCGILTGCLPKDGTSWQAYHYKHEKEDMNLPKDVASRQAACQKMGFLGKQDHQQKNEMNLLKDEAS